jgi:cytochrome c-type biogenesis protein CcmF
VIAEAGLAALWLAAALSLLQLLVSLAGERSGNLRGMVVPVAVAQGLLTLFAFAMLIWLFLRTDLSVQLVAANSHSMKPWIYRFAGAWGNHEGSMLLWVTVLTFAGAALALLERRLGDRTLQAALGAQAALALGFFAFLLLASNPFERLNPAAPEGRGLNPLLQDPGLAFHPPTLYFGYVGLSVAFSLAVGALITREVGPALARAMRPWVLGAWVLLTFGITAGSYWAYYELGWGGWWFWDPVENASLMPWLAATALLHSINVLAARGGLRAWTIMLAVVAFSMSMVGTFLVRSGILTSVHSFAVDPERGTFILALLILYIGAALLLFALRVGTVREGARFEIISREGALVGNNLLLSVILGTVFVGTLYPLFIEAATGEKLSVGPPYFNAVTGPLTLALALLLFIGPLLRWRRDSRPNKRRLALPLATTVLAFGATFLLSSAMSVLARLGLSVAAGLAVASVLPLVGRCLRPGAWA